LLHAPPPPPPEEQPLPKPVEMVVPAVPAVVENQFEPLNPQNPEVHHVDLKSRIAVESDTVNGFWTREGADLKSDGTAFGRIEIPYEPPENYDFKIVFTTKTQRGDVAQLCYGITGAFTWKMGALSNRYAMFEAAANNGDNNESRYLAPPILESGKTYESIVRVRGNLVEGYLNGKRLSRLRLNPTGARAPYSYWVMPHVKTLGVGVWATVATFSTIEIDEIGAQGRWLRAEGEKTVPRFLPELAPEEEWGNEVDLLKLVDVDRDTVSGSWRQTKDGIISDEAPFARIETSYRPPEEYDLRITFTRRSGNTEAVALLGEKGRAFQFRAGYRMGSLGFAKIFGTDFNPTTSVGEAWVQRNVPFNALIQVRKNYVAAFNDRKLVIFWPTDFSEFRPPTDWVTPNAGFIGFGSNASSSEFTRIQLRPIGAEGTILPSKELKRMAAPPPQAPGADAPKPAAPKEDAF